VKVTGKTDTKSHHGAHNNHVFVASSSSSSSSQQQQQLPHDASKKGVLVEKQQLPRRVQGSAPTAPTIEGSAAGQAGGTEAPGSPGTDRVLSNFEKKVENGELPPRFSLEIFHFFISSFLS